MRLKFVTGTAHGHEVFFVKAADSDRTLGVTWECPRRPGMWQSVSVFGGGRRGISRGRAIAGHWLLHVAQGGRR